MQATCKRSASDSPTGYLPFYRWDDIDFIRTLPAAALEDLARAAKMQPGHAAKFVALIGEQQAASHNSSVRCLLQMRVANWAGKRRRSGHQSFSRLV